METESVGVGLITQKAKALFFLTTSLFLGTLLSGCATKPPPPRVDRDNAAVYYGGVYLVA